MLDKNGVIQLGVGIRNLKSFVAGEADLRTQNCLCHAAMRYDSVFNVVLLFSLNKEPS